MAAPILITADNWSNGAGGNPLLVRSTTARGATPNGNVYIDTAGDTLQLISLAELATVDLGAGAEANPLTALTKVQLLAVYFFLLDEVQTDSSLQNFVSAVGAAAGRLGRLAGSLSFLNGIKLADGTISITGPGGELGDDRLKIAQTGFTEFGPSGGIDRIYHGVFGTGAVLTGSQPYYLIAADTTEASRQAATPIDFNQLGNPLESVQVFGDTGNGDTGAGTDDDRTSVLITMLRTFGQTPSEVNSVDVNQPELGNVVGGYPLTENPDTDVQGLSVTEADVFGGSAIAPYTGMDFSILSSAQTETGFTQADGDFTRVIGNTGSGSLTQVRAFLDVLAAQDTDENANTGATGAFNPKRHETFYTIDAGIVVFKQGYFVNLPIGDRQSVRFVDDAAGAKTYPFTVSIQVTVSGVWFNDPGAWFRLMFTDGAGGIDFDTASAETVLDASGTAIAGSAGDARISGPDSDGNYLITAGYDYDGDTGAGLAAGIDKSMTFQCGGFGVPNPGTQRRTVTFPVTRTATVPVNAVSDAETNA